MTKQMKKGELSDIQKEFLKFYRLEETWLNIKDTCSHVKISRQTFYNWMDKVDSFKKEIEAIKEGFKDDVESVIGKKIAEGDTTMIIFFAKTRMKDRGYIEKQKIEHEGNLTITKIKRVIVDSNTDN